MTAVSNAAFPSTTVVKMTQPTMASDGPIGDVHTTHDNLSDC
jgi:hypothetical protein